MACTSCSPGKDGKPGGCNSNGGCGSGGCNRLNTYDWLAVMDISDPELFDVVEVSFSNGSRKGFYRNPEHVRCMTGDMAVVDTGSGFDIGKISLTGELVRLQMKKKKAKMDTVLHEVLRVANERDLQRLAEARAQDKPTMVRARAIARTLDLDMKIGDVEHQGDRRKATFYYTADGRIDFRELIRHFAKEFRVKVEMRQIGARQESARIGGIGSCGRELCCSTWLSDFKSVSTAAARYQNLAINQSKLSGQCGRLKCCLNYELDSYMDALGSFPKRADKLKSETGQATLIKTDVFKGLMYYIYEEGKGRGQIIPLSVERVKEIIALNKEGEFPLELRSKIILTELEKEEASVDFAGDVTGVIELPMEKRSKNRNRNRNRKNKGGQKRGGDGRGRNNEPKGENKTEKKTDGPRNEGGPKSGNKNQRKNRNKKRPDDKKPDDKS